MDRQALLSRYQDSLPTLRRVATQRLLNPADVEDALQDAFMKAWLHCDSLATDDACDAWLRRILINVCIDEARRKVRRKESFLAAWEIADEPVFLSESLWLRQSLEKLQEGQRAAAIGFYLEGLSIRQLSQRLQRAEGTIKCWLHQARHELRRILVE